MKRLALALCLLAACGGPSDTRAWVVCEQFVERRVGAVVEFDDQATIEPVDTDTWYVRSRADADGVFTYECTVSHAGDEWTLENLTTDR